MTRACPIYQVDAFTRTPYAGNPAGVVLDADDLDTATMQAIARELANPESAFVLSPSGPDHDMNVRYFTPTIELPFCGHATIALHYVLSKLGHANERRQNCGIGVLPISVSVVDGDHRVVMTQAKPEFSTLDESLRHRIVAALRIDPSSLDDRLPIEVGDTGHAKALIAVRDSAALNAIAPDMSALIALSPEIGAAGYFVFTLDPDVPGVLTEARMFAPAVGVDEDPVTGSGQGPLGAYLVRHRIIDGAPFTSLQGRRLGRPGLAYVSVDSENGVPIRVRVGGDAVIAFSGTLNA
jgi:PhzF family phenazine biosynthesis protein